MIVRGGTVVLPDEVVALDIAIGGDGTITAVGKDLDEDGEELDAGGLHVFSGGIDSHVHFNEPGHGDWETIADGSAALAAGGYTAFVDMPLNNLPVTTTADGFDLKLAAMHRSAKVDFGLWGGLVPGNAKELRGMHQRGAMGFKAFMCPSGLDQFPMCDEATLREGMKRIADLDSILLVHAEDPRLLREPTGPTAREFIESRPVEAEVEAIRRAIDWAGEAGCALHVVHVSSLEGAELIHRTTSDVSGETCPHYMLFTELDMTRIGAMAKCAPPFRAEPMPILPIVVSDHSPSTLDLKAGDDFRRVWGGISGCQTTRQLLLAVDRLELRAVAVATSTNVARRFRITGKGKIATGFDADLWLVDLAHRDVVRREDLLYRNKFSAHEGRPIRGRTVATLVRGAKPGSGRFIRPGVRQ